MSPNKNSNNENNIETARLSLAKTRMELAKDLLADAKILLEQESFRSANNRAFYSMEKSVKGILALKGKDSSSHTALMRTFHNEYVSKENAEDACFTKEEYKMFQTSEMVRTNSDYDDFYICSKEECMRLVEYAEYYYNKCLEIVESLK
jgi:uncharacterized protein (UPF0332 family)